MEDTCVEVTEFQLQIIMDKPDDSSENAIVALQVITKLIQDFEKKVSLKNAKVKEFNEIKILKEKCCDSKMIISSTAFHGIVELVKRNFLEKSKTVSMIISLLPGITHYGALVTAVGDILLLDLQHQILEETAYQNNYSLGELKHPFIIVLKHNKEESWIHVYQFILRLMENKSYPINCKIKLLRPIFHYIFWSPTFKASQFQVKLFNTLTMYLHQSEVVNFTLEVLMWQDIDVHYCFYLKDFFIYLLKSNCNEKNVIMSATIPLLAVTIKWLIVNGHDPSLWINLTAYCLENHDTASSVILYVLTDAILETPSVYINLLLDLCKTIVFRFTPNKYVTYRFLAVTLNWFVNPSSLVHPLYHSVNEIVAYLNNKKIKWSDNTSKLIDNKYFKMFVSNERDIKFAADLIILSDSWCNEDKLVFQWLKNLEESNQHKIQFKLHLFLFGIILSENDSNTINLCLNLLCNLSNSYKDISFSLVCLIFYKLVKEIEPSMQRAYIFTLPKLGFKKENIPLIVGIIESLRKGQSKIMMPIVTQLYLSLWKIDNRTYSYLHRMLHDENAEDYHWELIVSKSIALREICRLAPHSLAKDLVGVLSKILNQCADQESGLASAIAIEAVTELCKSFVIDVAGTWNAIQPKLRYDKRPQVIISLCGFFGEIPNLNSQDKYGQLIPDVVLLLWNYSFSNDVEIIKRAFRALSNFEIENLPLKLLPEVYRKDIQLPKTSEKGSKPVENILALSYVPGECWIQFLQKIDETALEAGANLLIAVIERELSSLPRPIFFLAPEKPEPLSYSYLPQKSTCRAMIDCLHKHVTKHMEKPPLFIKEIIRILSHNYSKLLPPLNWGFMENILSKDWDLKYFGLILLTKQGSTSKSAKSVVENYLNSVQWNFDKLEEISQLYKIIEPLCKAVSYNILQRFLENTIAVSLEAALKQKSEHFEKILINISLTLKKSSVQNGHKALMAKELEKVVVKIPPEHEAMKSFALCAVEFPVQAIERLTFHKSSEAINSDAFRRTVIIRRAIGMRTDIKAPLVWLNQSIEDAVEIPSEQSFVLETIWSIIRKRRDCDYKPWMKELLWRIQEIIINQKMSTKSSAEAVFLIDVFMSVTILLSGYDCFFKNVAEFTSDKLKFFQIFPPALRTLLCLPEWANLLPKVGVWLQKLYKWNDLPDDYLKVIIQSLLSLKEVKSFLDESSTTQIFDFFLSAS